MADNIVRLGELCDGTSKKDAIHIAVIPVTALENLEPGTHVSVTVDGYARKSGKTIGVVDPFLKQMVRVGQHFYLCMYPNTVKSLRHEWEHDSFPETPKAVERENTYYDDYDNEGRCAC